MPASTPARLPGHSAPVTSLISRNYTELLSAGEDGNLFKWDLNTSTSTLLSKAEGSINAVAVGSNVLYYSMDNVCYRMDERSHEVQALYTAQDEINSIDASTCQDFVAICDDSGAVNVVDSRTGKPFKKPRTSHGSVATCVKFTPSKQRWQCWSGGLDQKVNHPDDSYFSGTLAKAA
jgi:WD40 repeat protein